MIDQCRRPEPDPAPADPARRTVIPLRPDSRLFGGWGVKF